MVSVSINSIQLADLAAPFQIIHVGAAAPQIPQPLIDQVGGKAF